MIVQIPTLQAPEIFQTSREVSSTHEQILSKQLRGESGFNSHSTQREATIHNHPPILSLMYNLCKAVNLKMNIHIGELMLLHTNLLHSTF
uniref:Uncharacterized protein n=1 Tax=Solanum lycopersicum TaxID=4081 RepID=A0A3Q7GCA9_SOLLC